MKRASLKRERIEVIKKDKKVEKKLGKERNTGKYERGKNLEGKEGKVRERRKNSR